MIIYNTSKHRLETIDIEITEENSTWFDDNINADSVAIITDFENGLLIKQCNFDYPMLFNGISRVDINHSCQKAQKLLPV